MNNTPEIERLEPTQQGVSEGTKAQKTRKVKKKATPKNVKSSASSGGFIQNLRVWQKLALIITVFVLGTSAVAFTSTQGLQVMRYHLYNIYEFMFVPITSINRADAYLTEVEANMAALVENPLEEQRRIEAASGVKALADEIITLYETEWLTTGSEEFTASLRELGRLDLQAAEVETFTALLAAYNEFNALQETYFASVRSGTPNQAVGQAALAAISTTLEQLNQLIAINDDFAALSYETAVSTYQRSLSILFVGLGLSIGLGLLLAYIVSRSITNPIGKLVAVSQRIGKGDLSELVKINAKNELGLLGQSLDNTIVQLRGKVQSEEELERERREREELQANVSAFLDVAMDIAEGDFTKRGNVTEDVLGNIVDAINLMVEEVAYLLTQTQDAAQSVNQGASEMIATTESIAQNAQRQAAEAERARTETEQVTASIRKIAQQADESANASTRALEASRQGESAVQNTLKGMEGIRNEVQGITERTKNLTRRSDEISGIVRSISRIASQTNLLALSASLEAAGAGEAGKRFAAVASEVQELAEDSANAARQVAGIIRELQSEIREVTELTESGSKEVETGYQVAAEAGQRLREIADISTKSAELARFISQATQEQVQGVEGVNEIVQTMTEISQASQGSVTGGRDAAEKLQQLAAQLSDSLSRFRLSA